MRTMPRKIRFKAMVAIALALLLQACVKEVVDVLNNPGKVVLGNDPQWVLPLANLSLKLEDIIDEKQDTVVFGDDGNIRIKYHQDSLFSFKLDEFVDIPTPPSSDTVYYIPWKVGDNRVQQVFDLNGLGIGAATGMSVNGSINAIPTFTEGKPVNLPLTFDTDEFTWVKLDGGTIKVIVKNNFNGLVFGQDFMLSLANSRDYLEVGEDSVVFELVPNSTNYVSSESSTAQHVWEFVLSSTNTKKLTKSLNLVIESLSLEGNSVLQSTDGIGLDVFASNLQVHSGMFKPSNIAATRDSISFDMSQEEGVDIEKLVLESYTISTNIQSTLPLGVAMDIYLPLESGDVKTITVPRRVSESTPGSYSDPIDLSGETLLLKGPGSSKDVIYVYYQARVSTPNEFVLLRHDDHVAVSFTFSELKFSEVYGNFGNRVIDIAEEEIDLGLDIEILDKISGKLTLSEPKLQLNFSNYGIGTPLGLDLGLTAYSADNVAVTLYNDMQSKDPLYFNVKSPAGIDQTLDTALVIDADNNLGEFVSLPPSKIKYGGKATMNPNGETLNFIKSDAEVSASLDLELPLILKLENVSWEGDVSEIDSSTSDALDAVLNASLFLWAENHFPIGFKLSLVVYNADTVQIGDTIMFNNGKEVIGAPDGGKFVNGKVVEPYTTPEPVELALTAIDIDLIQKGSFMKVVPIIASSKANGEFIDVVFYTDYELKLKLAAKATISGDELNSGN